MKVPCVLSADRKDPLQTNAQVLEALRLNDVDFIQVISSKAYLSLEIDIKRVRLSWVPDPSDLMTGQLNGSRREYLCWHQGAFWKLETHERDVRPCRFVWIALDTEKAFYNSMLYVSSWLVPNELSNLYEFYSVYLEDEIQSQTEAHEALKYQISALKLAAARSAENIREFYLKHTGKHFELPEDHTRKA